MKLSTDTIKFSKQQVRFIQKMYKEYKKFYGYTDDDMRNIITLKSFIYTMETHLGTKSVNTVLNPHEDKLFLLFLSSNGYSNELIEIIENTVLP